MSEKVPEGDIEENILDKIDELYLTIDTLNIEEIDKVIKYAEEQKIIANLTEKRRKDMVNKLRVERIRYKKELNDIKAKKYKNDTDDSSESDRKNKNKKKLSKK
jgi:hypothetical protein